MSSGIVGVVLWGSIILLGFFLYLLGRAMMTAHREGPREHLREPVLKGWDESGTTPDDEPRP